MYRRYCWIIQNSHGHHWSQSSLPNAIFSWNTFLVHRSSLNCMPFEIAETFYSGNANLIVSDLGFWMIHLLPIWQVISLLKLGPMRDFLHVFAIISQHNVDTTYMIYSHQTTCVILILIHDHYVAIWTAGVTLWEIFSYGGKPYENTSVQNVLRMLSKGARLPKPDICTIDLYMIMLSCKFMNIWILWRDML